MKRTVPRALSRLRKICKALPEATEHVAWGEPVFKVRKKLFAMYANANNHHGGGRHALWLKAAPVAELTEDAYRLVAPKKLLAALDQ